MNCSEAQFRISEKIDGELTHSLNLELQAHLEDCAPCSMVDHDLTSIGHSASTLERLEPSDRVWNNIRSQLVSEGLIRDREKRTWGFWGEIFPLGTSLKPALGAVVAILVLVFSIYLLIPKQVGKDKQTSISPDGAVYQQLKEAESHYQQAELHYQQAIQELDEVSKRKLESLDPALAQIFNDNLATMDYYLKECKEAVQNNPENPLARHYLLTAYQKRVELMKTIIDSDSL